MQKTLKSAVTFEGVGLHSGRKVRMSVRPAPADHGIWFRRTDIELGDPMIPASWDAVERGPLCTRLVNTAGVDVSTVEHVMAALAGAGITNVVVDVNGPELPILDGSSLIFIRAFKARGILTQDRPAHAIEILKPISVTDDKGATATLDRCDRLRIEFHIDFPGTAIGKQSRTLDMSNGAFARVLSDSRTFCRREDVEAMRANGLARGGTIDNAVVVDGDDILTPGGLRHDDEAVRHKMLDALGDLALAGAPILGHYTGDKAGHSLTNLLLCELFARPDAYRIVTCTPEIAARLPGEGLVMGEIPEVA
ncbi:MAG: UDP-3-O-acyl-N-acetylglucosamine deacetylase [Marinibacterium sp.]|nr:UDP-3-O-acyl-N-acetylglucosamine deacetylase [Marinibacterium sp.]